MHATPAVRSFVAALCLLAPALAPAQTFTTPRPSPNASVMQQVGTTELTVKYSRPGVKGRAIWGALVPYEKAWRTGANDATQFTCTDDITVEGQKLAAGTYALVTFPTKSQWIVAFSKQKDMWGAFTYDEREDALRVTVTPVPNDHVEWMQFAFDEPAVDAVTMNLRWEKLRVPVRITVDTNGKVLAQARAAVAAAKSDDWRTPYRAANWALDAKQAPEEAAAWAKAAHARAANFFTVGVNAKLLAQQGDVKSAMKWMSKSIELGKADTTVAAGQIEANEKLLGEWSAKK